ncbi:MAG: hypothetical protein WDO18_01515 [Acidobacteriota bacterium]
MEYYALLATVTAIIVILALALYRRSRDLGTILGTGALYYWSLFGAWYIVLDKTGGSSGKFYQYLETKMFPIVLDGDYLLTLFLYGAFIIVVQLTLLVALRRDDGRPLPRLLLRHEPILALTFLSGLASMLLIQDELSAAWATHTSAYIYTRHNPSQWFTLHQVLNRAALLPAAIGLATLQTGTKNRYFVNVRRRYTLWGYVFVLGGMCAFTFLLGNKNEVLAALMAGVLAYIGGLRRPNWWRAVATFGLGIWFLFSIDYFRSFAASDLTAALTTETNATNINEVARFVTSSNESYAAHFSMYGVLSRHVEPQFGYSIYSLLCSVVPRVLWKDRPNDIYLYYSESVGTVQNQGYSLHHATGWYLNFGAFGVLLGGLVMGLVWAWCINARRAIRPRTGLPFRLFAIVAPWFFAACLPPMLRAGPEAYKGLVIEGALIPVGVLLFACRPKRSRRRTPGALAYIHATTGIDHHPLPQ